PGLVPAACSSALPGMPVRGQPPPPPSLPLQAGEGAKAARRGRAGCGTRRYAQEPLNPFAPARIQAGKMDGACLAIGTIMPPARSAQPTTDADLARAAADGDTRAFEMLYRRHVDRVHGAVLRLAGYDHAR